MTDYYSNLRLPSDMSKQRDDLDWTSGNQITNDQSTDHSSAPSQLISNPQTWSSNTSSNNVFNLLSSSGQQEISRIEASFNQLDVNSREGRTCPNVAIKNTGARNVKPQICKSRLPVRVSSNKLCSQSQPMVKDKAKENVVKFKDRKRTMHRVRERLDPFENLFPKSRIPVMKAIKHIVCSQARQQVGKQSAVCDSSITTNRGSKQLTKSRSSTQQRYSFVKIPGRSSTMETGRKNCGVVSKNLRTRSGSSQVVKHLNQTLPKEAETSLEGKTLPIEDEESCSLSTTRNTSLSEPSRASRSSCPSRTSTSTSTTTSTPSTRHVKAEVEQASSEMVRRRRRKSRRTLGEKEQEQKEEGSQVDQPIKAPVTENETSL
ncbi:uncharacterized protein [Paralichthys olivaceus]|uniref:uncharacterized protein n=1 Tax=Paralichthys olivaceus TaxID=8255 RepID=UPI0037533DCD